MMSRAFSLFEVLVVLVIMSLASAMMLSLLSQLNQNLARFFPAAEHYGRLEVRTGMLTKTINGLIPSHDKTSKFSANQTSLAGLSSYFPGDPWPNEHGLQLTILESEGYTILRAQQQVGKSKGQKKADRRFDVLKMICKKAYFAYLDINAQWVQEWTQKKSYPYLPLAVRFTCEQGAKSTHIIAAIEREGQSIISDVEAI